MSLDFLFDGAFGTYYQLLTGDLNPPEAANIHSRETVLQIHESYIRSGANAVKTNTFGANLGVFHGIDEVKTIIRAGCETAFSAAENKGVSVFADIGPIASQDINSEAHYKEIAGFFIEAGIRNFLFETMAQFTGLIPAIKLIKSTIADSVVIVSFAVSQDGYTKQGEHYLKLFEQAASDADYVGINCICGPLHMQKLIEKCDTQKYRVSAMPNSGYPSLVNERTVYIDNPAYFAEKLLSMYGDGVKILGGCCGTTPDHIKAVKEKLESTQTGAAKKNRRDYPVSQISKDAVFESKEKIIAVEIDPPADTDVQYLLSASKRAKLAGADFITVPDSPLARTKADSIMLASKIEREVGIKTIPHLACRDKNQIAIKAQLIAGNIEGLQNILAVTGDPISQTDRSQIKNVFGFNSFRLISFINSLNSDLFSALPFYIFAALNISAVNFTHELSRAQEKIRCGADVFITQPVYSKKQVENIRLARKRLNAKILAGIMPIASYRNAVFLNNEVSGINIPEEIIEKLRDSTPEQAKEISVSFCNELIDAVYDYCDGYCIMTPLKKIDFTHEIIKYLRKKQTN